MLTLTARSVTNGSADEFGNPTVTWVERSWVASGLAPGAVADPMAPNRDASVVAWTVYAPSSDATPTDADQVLVDGTWFPVNGQPADWTRGPFGVGPGGVVVELRRADG